MRFFTSIKSLLYIIHPYSSRPQRVKVFYAYNHLDMTFFIPYSVTMSRVLALLFLVLLVLLAFSSFFWLYEAKFLTGRASVSQASFSVDNSYVFVSPLQAKANTQEKIRVTVFVLNNQGLGVLGKTVSLTQNPNLKTDTIQSLTDGFGKSVFDVSSGKTGEYYLDVTVDGSSLNQKAHLTFD